jgi:chromosome segregation ATPase
MSEERTGELPDPRSFEERVFTRFDTLDARSRAMETRFDGMNARFDAMETRFDAMETRFDAMETGFDAMEARFEKRFSAIDKRFDGVDARLDSLDGRVQALEARALDTKPIWERALVEILEVRKGVEDLNRKIDVLNQDVLQVRADQRRVEKRMTDLETRVQ